VSWNYRVVRRTYWTWGARLDQYTYAIHEAYYGADGKITALTENPVGALSDGERSLAQVLDMMAEALSKPVVDFDTREELP